MNEYRYYIKKITKKADDTVILELGDIRGIPVFDFQPGQYVMIYYKDEKGRVSQKHTFSIASSPFENGSLRLGIRVTGPFTQGLTRMKEGDEIFVSGPFGNFTFRKDQHFDLVFIAGGVGITPFISAIRYAAANKLPNKMTLIYSNRTLKSTLFLEEILELEKQNENLRVLFFITDEELPYEMESVVNRRVDARILKEFLGGTRGKTFFICGPGGFTEAMKENLRRIGVYDFQIETEGFSMIADGGWRPKIRNTAYALGFAAAVFLVPFFFIQKPARSASSNRVAVAELDPTDDAGTDNSIDTSSADDVPVSSNATVQNGNSPGSSAAAPSVSAAPTVSNAPTVPAPVSVSPKAAAPAPRTHVS